MKYFVFLMGVFLFSCSSKQIASNFDLDLPQPPVVQNAESQRRLASEEEYLGTSYEKFFGDQNYIGRLHKLRKLVRQLHFLMEEKGHPRKRILKKFQDDLDQQIAFLERLETDQNVTLKSWLPAEKTYQYGAKIRTLQAVKNSSDVMARLEAYLASTKVMEDSTYDQNFYYNLMRKGLKAMADDLAKVNTKGADALSAHLSYANYLSSVARAQLHTVFPNKSSKVVETRLNATFRQIQQVRSVAQAKSLVNSPEVVYASQILANADYTSSSDIEGSRDDMDKKIATYFGLEMIKYLYGQLN